MRKFVALFLCACALTTSDLRAQELTTVQVVGSPIDDFKTVYYAAQAGIFRKYGLNVEITSTGSGAASLAAVIGGSAQVALSSLPSLLQAHIRGVPLKIVAPAQLYVTEAPAIVLLVGKDSPIRSARDMNGKLFGTPSLGDLGSLTTLAWIDRNGGDSKTVKVIELPFAASLPALEDGRVDAIPVAAPYFDQALQTGRVRILAKPMDVIAKRFEATAYIAMDSYITDNTDTMVRFGRAMHEAIVYVNAHLPETVNLVASYSGVDPAVVAKSVRAIDPEYVEARNIQPLIDFAAAHSVIAHGFEAQEIIAPTVLKPQQR